METMSFYTPASIGIEDIALWAMKVGFKTYFAPPSTVRLMVEYVFEHEGEYRTSAWAFWASDAISLYRNHREMLGDTEIEVIERIKATRAFGISYRPYSLPQLVGLLKALLEHYGGGVLNHETGDFYSLKNILDMKVPAEG
jgi:hypothetical protein